MGVFYKFYIVNLMVETEVYPIDYPIIAWAKDGENYKREDLDVELTGDSYDVIAAIGDCSAAHLKVVRQSDLSEQFNGKIYWKSDNQKTKVIKFTAKEEDDKDLVEANSNINVNIFEEIGDQTIQTDGTVEVLASAEYEVVLTTIPDTDEFSTTSDRITTLQIIGATTYTSSTDVISEDRDLIIKIFSSVGVLLKSVSVITLEASIELEYAPVGSYSKFYLSDVGGTLFPYTEYLNISAKAELSKLTIDSVILQTGTPFPDEASYRKFANAITIGSSDYDIYFAYVSRTRLDINWTEINGLYYLPYLATAAIPTFSSDLIAVDMAATDFYCGENLAGTYYVTNPLSELEFPSEASNSFTLNGVNYDNGVPLRIIINQSLNLVVPNLFCVSSFLFADAVEAGSTWTNTETGGFNLGSILLFKAYDIKNPTTLPRSTTATTTLSAILEMLKFFNCYSFIDADGYYRIEHISYKESTGSVDLRTVETQRGEYCVWPLQELEYTEDGSEGVIILKPSVSTFGSFGQSSVVYQGACVDNTKVNTIQMNSFIFDYNQVIAQDENIDDSSIVVITRNDLGFPSNWFSPQNAAYFYYRHEANQQFYNIPSLDIENREALTLIKNIGVETVNYPEKNSPFDIGDLYKTYYQDGAILGEVDSAKINTKIGNVELNLLFAKS